MSSIDSSEQTGSTPIRRGLDRLKLGAEIAENGPGDVSFLATIFAQLNLPYRNPKGNPPYWRRINGSRSLIIRPAVLTRRDGTAEAVYPHGTIPRLFLIWLCTEVLRTGSQTIELGKSLNDFLRELGMHNNGRDAARVKEQVSRLLNCTMTVEDSLKALDQWGVQGKHFSVASEYQLWFSNRDRDGQEPLFGSSVTLTDDFHAAVENSVPLSKAVVRELRNNPMQLDIYTWLVNRLYKTQKPTKITWTQLQNQFGGSYKETRQFKSRFKTNLQGVLPLYVGAQVEIQDDGIMLRRSKKHIPQKEARKSLPKA
ncbi:replication initiation protein [Arthrobacter pigmenti]